MKYKIVREESTKAMMETVQMLLDSGWDLFGDLHIIVMPGHGTMYVREMVKYDDDDMVWELPYVKAEETINAN